MADYYNKDNRQANRAGDLSGAELDRFKEDRRTAIGRTAVAGLTGPAGMALLDPIYQRKDLSKEYARGAEDMGTLERPLYEIPQATIDATTAAKREYESDRTYSEGILADRIQASQANAVNAASKFGNSGDVLNTIQGVTAGVGQANQNLAMMSEDRRRNNFNTYMGQLGQMAQQQQQRWMYDRYQPYYDDLNRQRDLQAGSTAMRIQAGDMTAQLATEGLKVGGQLASSYITGGGKLPTI